MSKKKNIKKNTKKKAKQPTQPRMQRICIICNRPHKRKGCDLCMTCKRKAVQTGLSNIKLLAIMKEYNVEDPFALIERRPDLVNYTFGVNYKPAVKAMRKVRSELKAHNNSPAYINERYKKWDCEVPLYIKNAMKEFKTRQFITISGDKLNPNIHYKCIACNEEHICKFNDIKKGHSCDSNKSSGQILVEEYLKSRRKKYFIEHEALKCINPITGRQLPYDIEIVDHRVVIEIQGAQHLQYTEYFHGSIENFEYQQKKDDYKKRFAEKYGYKVLYIYYDDFADDTYKMKIDEVLR